MKPETQLEELVKANAKLIQLISYETERIHGIIYTVAENTNKDWYVWSRVEGLKKWNWDNSNFDDPDDKKRKTENVLKFFKDEAEDSIVLLEDFHHDYRAEECGASSINTIKRLRNIASSPSKGKTLIFSQPFYELPRELEKEVYVLDIPLPDIIDIQDKCEQVCESFGIGESKIEKILSCTPLMNAALGLTVPEIELAFSRAYVRNGRLTENEIPTIIEFKENIIRKAGHLEYFHPKDTIQDVGGLENLVSWAERRRKTFGKEAKAYQLDPPKGILLLGIPGTGKSLFAKAIGNLWQFPLLRLDLGKIFGGIVGQSERNIREALQVAEALSPSILWIDEIEKGLSGSSSSGETDGGTSARVLGTFLTWMQEKTKPVFVVATANSLSLPPELLRKGRIDEIFFVDLPGEKSREEIFSIHLRKRKRESLDFNLNKLVKQSKGFTGAEIQEAVKEGLVRAFDEERKLTTNDITKALKDTYPQSKVMGDDLEELRKWAKGRTVPASKEEPEPLELTEEDKEKPKLSQESSNPFIRRNRKKSQ